MTMTMPASSHRGVAVPSLTAIGLSADADLVYRHLAMFGPHRMTELCHALGVRSCRMRAALDELSDIGAARTVADGVKLSARRWRCAAPDTVAANIRARQREAAIERHRLHRRLAKLTELGLSDVAPGGRLLCSITRAQARANELIAAERHEHLVMNPTVSYDEGAVRAAADANKALLDNRIAVRELGVPPIASDSTGQLTEQFASAGAQFRQLSTVPFKFMIFDRSAALIRIDADDPDRGVLEITDPTTIQALVELFMRYWQRASEYRTGRKQVDLTERERAIVRLLAAGINDSEIATELGLSVRTIAYTMRDLMDKCGANNRFQLGLALSPVIGPPTTLSLEIEEAQRRRTS